MTHNAPKTFSLKKAAFLDRDGIINRDVGYLSRPENLEWIDGVFDAVRLLNENEYEVYIVTNQSGIARGFYTEAEYLELQTWIETELRSAGAIITLTLYCPHHPTEGLDPYRIDCDCRKPKPGMLNRVLSTGNFDLEASFMIGDKPSDVEAAQAAGIRGFQFESSSLFEFIAETVLPSLSSGSR